MGQYKLHCPGCNANFEDIFTNLCPVCGNAGPLIKADYQDSALQVQPLPGFWKFLGWLPCEGWNENITSGTIVYKSTEFAGELGLKNLWIAFNGYWPEKNANMVTCTFKELEAPPTLQRAQEKCIDNIVLASAGNTAKAFIFAAQYYDVKVHVVIPKRDLGKLVLPFQVPENVVVIVPNSDCDYSDAILLAGRLANDLGMVPEGGARNVARRDGMATVMLEAFQHLKCLPDHYFQAVGSGTGAIAVFEAAERLIASGHYPGAMPKLQLSQNEPFTPLTSAWNKGAHELLKMPEHAQRAAIDQVFAKVLTNRFPPYSVGGGVYDILTGSDGVMYGVTNGDAKAACRLFKTSEGVEPVPAACVALGSLVQAVETNKVEADDKILINITGGGEQRLWDDFDKYIVEPDIICECTVDMQELRTLLEAQFDK